MMLDGIKTLKKLSTFVRDIYTDMFTESRKIQLLEEVLKTHNEATLVELEAILKKSGKKSASQKNKSLSIYDFVGILSKKESKEMRKTIEETCETINPDDWK